MGSTSSEQLLALCLREADWSGDLLDRAIQEDGGRALLSVVVERLGDLFEPRLCEVYRRLFTQIVERVAPELGPRLRVAGKGARSPQPPPSVERVYVLSRITLGADVAVASVLLDAAKRRYPDAEIVFAGPRKSYEMFAGDARIRHREVAYARAGSLAERLRASAALWFEDGIVIDPDSRLSQLGLISVCDEARYFWFESRSLAGGRLPEIAAAWSRSIFDVDARPYVAPVAANVDAAEITVSLGVGDNEAKRMGDDFERELLQTLAATGARVVVDEGGSAEEQARVNRVRPREVRTHHGSFAAFAAHIAKSKLYVGYDSAGGHVASACGVPSISIFAGAVSDRFVERWRPLGTVIRAEQGETLKQIRLALDERRDQLRS